MYAVIESGGFQFTVKEGDKVKIPKIVAKPKDKVTFAKILLVSKDNDPLVGTPYVEGAKIEAVVLNHGKGEKVVVFKFKRRVKYRRKTGHRQDFTEVQIKKINLP
ncbi:MAG: 50S ribosomal protein L21 [candidate division Zixibacteria bacterium SM23_73_2]|nr:MAG: 50S ribosomal protein L21 [candidate division Zixibacteria bacterium SM23_73_2]